MATSRGLTVSFGAWVDFLKQGFLSNYSESAISWIGTVQGFLMVFVGVAIGPVFDLGYVRLLIVAGMLLNVLGFILTGFAQHYYSTFLSLGVLVGLGGACLFTPGVAIVAQYFTTKRSTATGIASAGGSVGGLLLPIAFRRITTSIGYGWANRIFGLTILTVLLISLAIMKPRTLPSTRRKLFDLKAIMEPAYLLFCLGLFAVWTGMYLPFFYIPLYARKVLQVSEDLASYMLAFMGAGSVFGRIITNVLADKIGAIQSFLPVTFILGSLAFVWIGIKDTAGTIVFCVLYGFFSGASISLTPVMLTAVSPDLSVVGTRMGMAFSFASFGLLIGSPIGGVLIGTEAGYTAVQVFSGATILIGLVLHSLSGFLTARKGHLKT
ncbi:hypothetical protein HBI39_178420 [Parastagonospora nodorum]|nr:hypothetical protein HBI51_114920 [Parastagonospora nodorum]KAH6293575.1 hypothetical protein HBI39_178420 [Parastagonospora nodorum]